MTEKNTADLDRLINILLSPSVERKTYDSMAVWFNDFNQQTRQFPLSIDRAILGGRMSLNLSFSFASAYQSAIEALFQTQEILLSSFCVTEEKGNHPRAIETRLFKESGQLLVSGTKSFVSGATDSEYLYIACRDERHGNGIDTEGRPIIKMLAINVKSHGLEIKSMPSLGFIPELSHGKVILSNVVITDEQILPEDGYLNYVKAFRSYEDLYVLASVAAYRLGEAIEGKWPNAMLEEHISLLLAIRSVSVMTLTKPAAHIALAACRSKFEELIAATNSLYETSNPDSYQSWNRDKVLLNIAKKAHEKRTIGAWDKFRVV